MKYTSAPGPEGVGPPVRGACANAAPHAAMPTTSNAAIPLAPLLHLAATLLSTCMATSFALAVRFGIPSPLPPPHNLGELGGTGKHASTAADFGQVTTQPPRFARRGGVRPEGCRPII